MVKQLNPQFAFTQEYNGIANKLISEVLILSPKQIPTKLFEPTKVRVLWDTGATHSAISENLANQLGLKSISKRQTNTANGNKDADVYLVDILLLPTKVFIQSVGATGVTLPTGVDGLIGMDIISRGDFSITNFEGKTCFSYRIPSSGVIDYVKKINSKKVKIEKINLKKEKKNKRKLAQKSKKQNRKRKK